jgi:hypothetical protein
VILLSHSNIELQQVHAPRGLPGTGGQTSHSTLQPIGLANCILSAIDTRNLFSYNLTLEVNRRVVFHRRFEPVEECDDRTVFSYMGGERLNDVPSEVNKYRILLTLLKRLSIQFVVVLDETSQ